VPKRIDPVGLKEIAEMAGVTSNRGGTVYQWKSQGILPPPDRTVSGNPVWDRGAIEQWLRDTGRVKAPEVQALLAEHGASGVATMYDAGKPMGLSFVLPTSAGDRTFTLPVLVDGVERQLQEVSDRRYRTREQAERVAWRVIKDWVEAQVALIEAGMATLEQIMLPYLQVEPGRTLYEVYAQQGARALEAAG
jgi:predicted DNA-binding transcriptional regulator AlpA